MPSSGPLTALQFKAAADQICLIVDSKALSLGPAGTVASPDAGAKFAKLMTYSEQAVTSLTALEPRGPAASQAEVQAFLKYVNAEDAVGPKIIAAADSRNKAAYMKQLGLLSKLGPPEAAAGKALAPACAQG